MISLFSPLFSLNTRLPLKKSRLGVISVSGNSAHVPSAIKLSHSFAIALLYFPAWFDDIAALYDAGLIKSNRVTKGDVGGS